MELFWFNLVRDLIIMGVAIIGSVVAIMGLKTWRRQLKGNTEYELARRLLKSAYQVRDKIKYVRNPFIDTGEISKAITESEIEIDQNDPKKDIKGYRAVYSMRWGHLMEATTEMQVELLEAEVIWGKEINEIFKDYNNLMKELYIAILRHFDMQEGQRQMTPENFKENDAILYDTGVDRNKDAFSGKIINAVEKIEEFIKPKLKI